MPRIVEQELPEQKPLSYYFNPKTLEEMIELLKNGFVVPRHIPHYCGFGSFSGANGNGNHWSYTLSRGDDERVFDFNIQFPFSIGVNGDSAGPTFEELFLLELQNLLGDLSRLEA